MVQEPGRNEDSMLSDREGRVASSFTQAARKLQRPSGSPFSTDSKVAPRGVLAPGRAPAGLWEVGASSEGGGQATGTHASAEGRPFPWSPAGQMTRFFFQVQPHLDCAC